jgi:hypothetical protein
MGLGNPGRQLCNLSAREITSTALIKQADAASCPDAASALEEKKD